MTIDPATMTWMLSDPECDGDSFDIWRFTLGEMYSFNKNDKFIIKKHMKGTSQNITFTTITGTPVINNEIALLLREEEDRGLIQLIPAIIENEVIDYYILNVINCIDCMEKKEDRKYLYLEKMSGNSIFRIKNDETILIVSDIFKNKIEHYKLHGVKFHDILSLGFFTVV